MRRNYYRLWLTIFLGWVSVASTQDEREFIIGSAASQRPLTITIPILILIAGGRASSAWIDTIWQKMRGVHAW